MVPVAKRKVQARLWGWAGGRDGKSSLGAAAGPLRTSRSRRVLSGCIQNKEPGRLGKRQSRDQAGESWERAGAEAEETFRAAGRSW